MEAEAKNTDCDFLEKTFPNVWNCTSREFHSDPNARADLIASHLKDSVTMKIFEEAIRFNRHLFKGKIILVLNAGIDLCFSLWAAKYGAAHVYAVDNSQAVDYVEAILEPNNMCGKITVLRGRIQDIELPVEKVDLILSNWMGYALLVEEKIRTVLYARDKWLKDAGIIFPDCADLLIAGVQNSKNKNQRIDWWRDVQSFNMNAIRKVAAIEPAFQKIDPSEILTMPVKVWSINLKTITLKELCFQRSFYIEITSSGQLEGLMAYFDVQFSKSHVPVRFSTSPWSPFTKWLQTVFYFDEPISANVKDIYHCGMQMGNVLVKNGNYATKTYLEFYSGSRSSLSLVFYRKWTYKWVYADHTDGVVHASVSSGAGSINKDSTSGSDGKSMNDKSSPKSQDDTKDTTTAATAYKKTKHDWSFDTMQKKLLDAIKKPCKNNIQIPLLADHKQSNEKSTKTKASANIKTHFSTIVKKETSFYDAEKIQKKAQIKATGSLQPQPDASLHNKNSLLKDLQNLKGNSITKLQKSTSKCGNQAISDLKVTKSATVVGDEPKTSPKLQAKKQKRKAAKKLTNI